MKFLAVICECKSPDFSRINKLLDKIKSKPVILSECKVRDVHDWAWKRGLNYHVYHEKDRKERLEEILDEADGLVILIDKRTSIVRWLAKRAAKRGIRHKVIEVNQ